MVAIIPKISALFETSLASALSAAGSSFTVVSGTDRDGNALSGTYAFIIDEGSADEEFVVGSISGTTVTVTYRGCDADDPVTEVSANKKAHRRGASVKITDYPIMGYLRNLLNGDYTFPGVLKYASGVAPSTADDLADKGYVDGVAIAGAPDSSTTVKGITKMSVAPASSTSPIAVGDNDPRVPTQGENDGLAATTSPASTNLFVTQKDFQKGAEVSGSTTGSANAYVFTPFPAIAAYVAGMMFRLKANFANTGAATLNVSSLGAIAIKKLDGATALTSGDIAIGQEFVVVYDGTNFQMVSPVASQSLYKNGVTSRAGDAASGSVTIAHGLGVIPKYVKITARKWFSNGTASPVIVSDGVYNGTTNSSVWLTMEQVGTTGGSGTNGTNIIYIDDTGGGTATQVASATTDATNITLSFTKAGSPNSANINIMWEAYA